MGQRPPSPSPLPQRAERTQVVLPARAEMPWHQTTAVGASNDHFLFMALSRACDAAGFCCWAGCFGFAGFFGSSSS